MSGMLYADGYFPFPCINYDELGDVSPLRYDDYLECTKTLSESFKHILSKEDFITTVKALLIGPLKLEQATELVWRLKIGMKDYSAYRDKNYHGQTNLSFPVPENNDGTHMVCSDQHKIGCAVFDKSTGDYYLGPAYPWEDPYVEFMEILMYSELYETVDNKDYVCRFPGFLTPKIRDFCAVLFLYGGNSDISFNNFFGFEYNSINYTIHDRGVAFISTLSNPNGIRVFGGFSSSEEDSTIHSISKGKEYLVFSYPTSMKEYTYTECVAWDDAGNCINSSENTILVPDQWSENLLDITSVGKYEHREYDLSGGWLPEGISSVTNTVTQIPPNGWSWEIKTIYDDEEIEPYIVTGETRHDRYLHCRFITIRYKMISNLNNEAYPDWTEEFTIDFQRSYPDVLEVKPIKITENITLDILLLSVYNILLQKQEKKERYWSYGGIYDENTGKKIS